MIDYCERWPLITLKQIATNILASHQLLLSSLNKLNWQSQPEVHRGFF